MSVHNLRSRQNRASPGEARSKGRASCRLMLWQDGQLSGYFGYQGRVYMINYGGGQIHTMTEIDPGKMPPDHPTNPQDNVRNSRLGSAACGTQQLSRFPKPRAWRWKPNPSRSISCSCTPRTPQVTTLATRPNCWRRDRAGQRYIQEQRSQQYQTAARAHRGDRLRRSRSARCSSTSTGWSTERNRSERKETAQRKARRHRWSRPAQPDCVRPIHSCQR